MQSIDHYTKPKQLHSVIQCDTFLGSTSTDLYSPSCHIGKLCGKINLLKLFSWLPKILEGFPTHPGVNPNLMQNMEQYSDWFKLAPLTI